MNFQELADRALLGECTSLEAKSVAMVDGKLEPHPDSLAQELAGLANAHGGHLLLGVDSERHVVTGVASDQLGAIIQRVDHILYELVQPPIYDCRLEFGTVVDPNGLAHTIIVIDVARSLYVHDVKGLTYIRVGTSKRRMDSDARSRLAMQRSQSKLMRFDEMPVPRCTRDDLDPDLVSELLENTKVPDLESLRLLTQVEGVATPNVTAVLLLTAQPSRWIRSAFLNCEIFRGIAREPANQVDFQRFEGPIPQQILNAFAFCRRHTRVRMIKDPARIDLPEYDEIAVFEALSNAVVHRDYSQFGAPVTVSMYDDRMEITSPGALVNSLTVESIALYAAARNETLVNLLSKFYRTRVVGEERYLIEGRRFGVPQIIQRSKAVSGREPRYDLIADLAVRLTIFAAPAPTEDT